VVSAVHARGPIYGGNQSNYIAKSFIFTERGLTMLDKTSRNREAVYRGARFTCPEELISTMLTRARSSRSTRQRLIGVVPPRSVSSGDGVGQTQNYFKASSSACTTTQSGRTQAARRRN